MFMGLTKLQLLEDCIIWSQSNNIKLCAGGCLIRWSKVDGNIIPIEACPIGIALIRYGIVKYPSQKGWNKEILQVFSCDPVWYRIVTFTWDYNISFLRPIKDTNPVEYHLDDTCRKVLELRKKFYEKL